MRLASLFSPASLPRVETRRARAHPRPMSRPSHFDESALTPAERASRRAFASPRAWRSTSSSGKRPFSPPLSPSERSWRWRGRRATTDGRKTAPAVECDRTTATVVAVARAGRDAASTFSRALAKDADFLRALTTDAILARVRVEDAASVRFMLENRRDWDERGVRDAFEESVRAGARGVVEAFLERAPETCALAPTHYLEVLRRGHLEFAVWMLEMCVEVPIEAVESLARAATLRRAEAAKRVDETLEGGLEETSRTADDDDDDDDDERLWSAYHDALDFVCGDGDVE